MKKSYLIRDDYGYSWNWNGSRVYCLEAEEEFIKNGDDPKQNGYGALSEDEAIQILISGGYIGKDPRLKII